MATMASSATDASGTDVEPETRNGSLPGPHLVKADMIRKRLMSEEPFEYIKRFQAEHGLSVSGVEAALMIPDLLGVSRGDVYRTIKQAIQAAIEQRVASLDRDTTINLLRASIPYITQRSLNEIPMKVLNDFEGDLPQGIYDQLASIPQETLLLIPDKHRRHVWELHPALFDSVVESLAAQFVASKATIRTSDNMSLALNSKERREKTRPLQKLKSYIGDSTILFERARDWVRKQFILTGNPILCTLLADILMVVGQKQVLTSQSVATIVDNLKEKHSSDRLYGRTGEAAEDIVNRLAEVIDVLYQEVIKARDGVLYENRPAAPPPPPLPPAVAANSSNAKKGVGVGGKKTRDPRVIKLVRAVLNEWEKNKEAKDMWTTFYPPVIQAHKDNKPLVALYKQMTPHPMDLLTMRAKTKANKYASVEEVLYDFELMRDNCVRFNQASAPDFVRLAHRMYEYARGLVEEKAPEFGLDGIGDRDDEDENDSIDGHKNDETTTKEDDEDAEEEAPKEDEDENDFDLDAEPKNIKVKIARPGAISNNTPAPPPLPPPKPVSMGAAEAAMVFCDPNTRHSLAKMMLDLLKSKVFLAGVCPRQVSVVTRLLWLATLGETAKDIVADFEGRHPNELLNGGPISSDLADSPDPHLLLHRVLPLLTRAVEVPGVPDGLIELCRGSALAREYTLRFTLLQIRQGRDTNAEEFLRATLDFADHPGFRRGLVQMFNAKSTLGMPQLRRFVIEGILLPHASTFVNQDNTIKDGQEFIDAQEFVATVIASPATLNFARDGVYGMEGKLLADLTKRALRGVTSEIYLSRAFDLPRQQYEGFFLEPLFSNLRGQWGIPVVPAGHNSNMSPGSTKMSPSPGTFRATSTSPSAWVPKSAGASSVSPSYTSPGL